MRALINRALAWTGFEVAPRGTEQVLEMRSREFADMLLQVTEQREWNRDLSLKCSALESEVERLKRTSTANQIRLRTVDAARRAMATEEQEGAEVAVVAEDIPKRKRRRRAKA